MATNLKYRDGNRLSLAATHPTTALTGKPCRVGPIVGVAETTENTAGLTTIDFAGVWNLSVKGANDAGNSAVAIGDALYYVDGDVNDGTGFLSKKASGYFAGYALETVTSGSTATIMVKLEHGSASGRANGEAALVAGLKVNVLAGAAAGDHTLAAIAAADAIVSVLQFDLASDTGTSATGNKVQNVVDLTAEFTAAAGKINNTSGTDTTGDVLVVVWVDRT